MLDGILNQTHITNFHNASGQLFWFSRKCVFIQKVLKRIIQNTPRKSLVFGHMVSGLPSLRLFLWGHALMLARQSFAGNTKIEGIGHAATCSQSSLKDKMA